MALINPACSAERLNILGQTLDMNVTDLHEKIEPYKNSILDLQYPIEKFSLIEVYDAFERIDDFKYPSRFSVYSFGLMLSENENIEGFVSTPQDNEVPLAIKRTIKITPNDRYLRQGYLYRINRKVW